MATTQSCVELRFEETPRGENAAITAPYRISTVSHFMPIQSVQLSPGTQFEDRGDELRGTEGDASSLVAGYEPGGSLAVRAYADELLWLLTASGFNYVKTAGDGIILDPDSVVIPTGATRWVFNKRGGLTAKSLQIIQAFVSNGVFVKGQGFGVSQLGMNAMGAVTCDLTGLVYKSVADPNLTPSLQSSAIPHLRRGDMTLTWMGSSGVVDDFSFQIGNELTRHVTMGTGSYFPDSLNHGDDRVSVTGTVPLYTFTATDVDALVGGTIFSAKARWKSPKSIGATAYKYSMWLEMPSCQIVGGTPDALSNARRVGASSEFKAAWDDTAGYDAKITIVGATSGSIETYV